MTKPRYEARRMSLDEYLAFEEKSSIKHEYVGGEVYAMSGTTIRHGRIAFNIARHLHAAARSHGCTIVLSDVKVRAANDRVYYPDVLMACGRAKEADLIVNAPTLIAEVTSPTTRATARREKLDAYLKMQSLRMYLIVDQRRRHVLAYFRDAKGEWHCEEIQGEGTVGIAFLDTQLTLDQIYEDVTLPPLTVKEDEAWYDAEWADYTEEDAY